MLLTNSDVQWFSSGDKRSFILSFADNMQCSPQSVRMNHRRETYVLITFIASFVSIYHAPITNLLMRQLRLALLMKGAGRK